MTEETTAPAEKTRKPKEISPYIVGQWLPDGKFKPCDKQPDSPITDFGAIVAWVRNNFAGDPGTYNFVRKAPKSYTLREQTTIKGTLA